MESEWEISKITNMSPDEVKKLLYDMALFNENEWVGDYNAYLKEHGAEMTLISSSAGLNEHAPQFFDFAYDADTGVSASTEFSAIGQIRQVMPHIKDSDMEELGEQVLGKLQNMTDEEFAEISLEAAE